MRIRANMLAAVSPGGQLLYMINEGNTITETVREFLGRIAADVPEKTIYVLEDSLRIHTEKRVR